MDSYNQEGQLEMSHARITYYRSARPVFWSLVAMTCSLAIIGCGSGDRDAGMVKAMASGTVTYKGAPVAGGKVQLYSAETGGGASAELDSSGKFSLLKPIPIGWYKVVISPPDAKPPESESGEYEAQPSFDNIPEKYRSELTTDINAEVKEGDNKFTWDMVDS